MTRNTTNTLAEVENAGPLSEERREDGTFADFNTLWRRRIAAGRPPKFANAEALRSAAFSYLNWVQCNPLHAEEVFIIEGRPAVLRVPKTRPMSIRGLCLHIGISHRQWNAWKAPESRQYRADLLPVIEWTEQIIWAQQLEGAAAGIFSARLVSRGLRMQ